jgi:CheY-like chemotaxis protein
MHGGSVEARSAGPGLGSEFVVRLPLPEPSRHSPAPADSPASPAAARRRRVLVVDDNVDSATSLAMIVELQGHETRLAHDGPSALEAAAAFRPDVALLDIGLPGLDGYQVAHHLRQSDCGGAARMTLVALTGYGQHNDRLRTREAGFDHHMVKPVDIDALLHLLDRPAPARPEGVAGADADAAPHPASGESTGFA